MTARSAATPAIGLRLPTLMSQAVSAPHLRSLARRGEEYGFDSLWCVDHLLAARYVFGAASWEPLSVLSFLAGCTERIQLGVSVLIAPLRQRVWLLKQLGTLSALAGDRVLLGLGVGWDEHEFAAAGADRTRRGADLDAILRHLLDARREGRLEIDGHTIDPAPTEWAEILCGGGSSSTVLEGGEPARLAPRVLERIASVDGWVVRSSASPDLMRSDLQQIRTRRSGLGERRGPTVARATFLHVSASSSTDVAVTEQLRAMRTIGYQGTAEQLRQSYPTGTIDEVVDWLRADVDAGATHLILNPVGDIDPQVELLAEHVLDAVRLQPAQARG